MKIDPVEVCTGFSKDTLIRVLPYWNEDIILKLRWMGQSSVLCTLIGAPLPLVQD